MIFWSLITAIISYIFYISNLTLTKDPRYFGPYLWPSFHIIAQNYPDFPNEITQQSCHQFIDSLPYMLPCAFCGYHLQEFISSQNITDICSNKKSLVTMFVKAHNNVSKHTGNRKQWTVEDAYRYYTRAFKILFTKNVWRDKKLIKE